MEGGCRKRFTIVVIRSLLLSKLISGAISGSIGAASRIATSTALVCCGSRLGSTSPLETFIRVTGIKAQYRPAFTQKELLHHFPSYSGMDGLTAEIVGMAEYGYYREDRDLLWSRKINPDALTWEQFLRNTGRQGQSQSFSDSIHLWWGGLPTIV